MQTERKSPKANCPYDDKPMKPGGLHRKRKTLMRCPRCKVTIWISETRDAS